jgi:hypothetical protein
LGRVSRQYAPWQGPGRWTAKEIAESASGGSATKPRTATRAVPTRAKEHERAQGLSPLTFKCRDRVYPCPLPHHVGTGLAPVRRKTGYSGSPLTPTPLLSTHVGTGPTKVACDSLSAEGRTAIKTVPTQAKEHERGWGLSPLTFKCRDRVYPCPHKINLHTM